MNQQEAIAMLKELSFPVFYGAAPIGTKVPFGIINITQPDNFFADDEVYLEKWQFSFSVYTTGKDQRVESEVKKKLKDNHIPWTRTETFLEDQESLQSEFLFSIAGNEDEDDGTEEH